MALGYAQSTLSNLERGSRRLDIVEMIDYCAAIGADPRRIMDELLKAIESDSAGNRRSKRLRRS